MFHVENCDCERMLASYWVSEDYLYDGFQVSYGLSEWASHSIFRVWLQFPAFGGLDHDDIH